MLAVINVWLAIRIGTRLFSPQTGWLAGWLYAFAPATLIFTGLVMTETLFATLLLSGTLLCIHVVKREHPANAWGYAALAGLVFAALVYTRPIALYYMVIPALALLANTGWSRRGAGRALTILIVCAAALAPWFYRNYTHFDQVVFTSIGNQNLLFYNVSSIEAHRQNISWDAAKDQLWREYGRRLDAKYTDPSPADESSLAAELAREHIARHPFEAVLYQTVDAFNVFRPGYSMTNLILHDDGQDVGQEVQAGNLGILLDKRPYEIAIYAGLTVYYLLLYGMVGVGSVVLLWRRNWTHLLLIGLTLAYFLYLPGRAGNARFRAPLEGQLAIVGAVGIVQVMRYTWLGNALQRVNRRVLRPAAEQ